MPSVEVEKCAVCPACGNESDLLGKHESDRYIVPDCDLCNVVVAGLLGRMDR